MITKGERASERYPGILKGLDGNWIDLNILRPRQNGRHFAYHIFKCISLNENVWILIEPSLKFVSKCPIDNTPPLVQIMALRPPGDKSLSEPMMISLRTHIWVSRPQWVKSYWRNWHECSELFPNYINRATHVRRRHVCAFLFVVQISLYVI